LDVKAEKYRTIEQALNRRRLTVESRDQFQVSKRGSFGRLSCTGTDFFPSTSDSSCQ